MSRRLSVSALAVAVAALALAGSAAAADRGFTKGAIGLSKQRLFDLGATNFDGNSRLDVFSANHMFRGSLLTARKGGFADIFDRSRLNPTPEFPGWERLTEKPDRDRAGLYVFAFARRKLPHVHLQTKRLGSLPGKPSAARGRIVSVFPNVRVRAKRNAQIQIRRKGPRRTVTRFTLGDNASVKIRVPHLAQPAIKVDLGSGVPLRHSFIGADAVRPKRDSFRLFLGDRHGLAWGDYNADGLTDVYITHGGVVGKLRRVRGLVRDELLLINTGKRFRNATPGSGLGKGTCRGREAATVDFNRDGRLDLFAACEDGRPRLYRRRGKAKFKDVSRGMRKVGSKGSAYRWLDVTGNGRMELVQARADKVVVWNVRRSGRPRKRQVIATRNGKNDVDALAPADYDGDGDLDIFVAAKSGNTMLVNRRGRLRARRPNSLGLPVRRTRTAAWVDYDNDGRIDLHLAPQGIFRNKGAGKRRPFRRTGLVRTQRGRFIRAEWFDASGNGTRDVALAVQRGTGPRPRVRFLRNTRVRRHWLQLDLTGRRGNPQAIGAKVRLRVGKRTQTQWVGQNDNSRYGQGHYRLYFGLGKRRVARSVRVVWPNGKRKRLGRVRGDRLVRVRQGGR